MYDYTYLYQIIQKQSFDYTFSKFELGSYEILFDKGK